MKDNEVAAFAISQLGIWAALAVIIMHVMNRIAAKDFFLVLAFSSFAELVSAWMVMRLLAPVDAITLAINLWCWWKNGGDDDTKKRWRQFKRKFNPVRRTAPATA